MTEFRINEHITLRLEEKETKIYVNGEVFKQCASILFQIPTDSLEFNVKIESIDDVAEKFGWSLEGQNITIDTSVVSPEEEFHGHCSNLQVWAENDYDSRLLHSNLSFPLLKKLSEIGDLTALKVFKEEISKRLEMGNESVILYLLEEKYIEFLGPEELEYVIQNSEIVEFLFTNGDLEDEERESYFVFFHQRAPRGLNKKFFDEKNNLKKIIKNLLDEFENTRYNILDILLSLYSKDPVLKEPLFKGIAEIFQKGSFKLIHDLLYLLEEGLNKNLYGNIEKIWSFNLFTKDSPVILEIFNFLKRGDIHEKMNGVSILRIIWRYIEYGLSEKLIKCILKDEENRVDLLLQLITVWYEGTTVLNYDSIHELENLGDHAYQELKRTLKGGIGKNGRYVSGKLDKLSFMSDNQEDWYDFNYTIEILYNLFGAQELIKYLDGFDGVDILIVVNKHNYPGPLSILAEAFIECSESNDPDLINKACNIYQDLNEWYQEQIVQTFPIGETIYERQEIIKFCLQNDQFEGIRFFLNFNILFEEGIGWLMDISTVNFLEKLIKSQKEFKYPSEKYNLFLEEMVYADSEKLFNSIHKLRPKEKKKFIVYLSDSIEYFIKPNISLSFSSFLSEIDSKVIENVEHKIGKKFRIVEDDPNAEVALFYENGNVTSIVMESLELRTVPEEISNLFHLKRLKISYNLLSSLPESLGKLINLEYLDVSHNPDLVEIPNVIKKLKNLKQIILT